MLILCTGINNTNFDETLLLAILSKFKLTSLKVCNGDKDEDIFMSLLHTPSVQETLEHFRIEKLDIYKCSSVIDLLVEFKRIKTIIIEWDYNARDKIKQWKQKIRQFEEIMWKKHSKIWISIEYIHKIDFFR